MADPRPDGTAFDEADGGLLKFHFEGQAVRGQLVRIAGPWRELLDRRRLRDDGGHPFPPEVRALLGEMVAAACLMQAAIRFEGSLNLQVFGDGPVRLAVVEVQPDLEFRATAKITGAIALNSGFVELMNVGGQGRCQITLDGRRPGQPPYQGIVPLVDASGLRHASLAAVLDAYMAMSEQIPSRFLLAADDDFAAGLLVQRMPVEGGANLGPDVDPGESFGRIALLAATLSRDELLTLEPRSIATRLFWQEDLRLLPSKSPHFGCRCSRERVEAMLRGLGAGEVDSIVAEQGEVEVRCDFCGVAYRFDPFEAAGLFNPGPDPAPAIH